jgi:hypothetical protein
VAGIHPVKFSVEAANSLLIGSSAMVGVSVFSTTAEAYNRAFETIALCSLII